MLHMLMLRFEEGNREIEREREREREISELQYCDHNKSSF